jgi:hypothetical protein
MQRSSARMCSLRERMCSLMRQNLFLDERGPDAEKLRENVIAGREFIRSGIPERRVGGRGRLRAVSVAEVAAGAAC